MEQKRRREWHPWRYMHFGIMPANSPSSQHSEGGTVELSAVDGAVKHRDGDADLEGRQTRESGVVVRQRVLWADQHSDQ